MKATSITELNKAATFGILAALCLSTGTGCKLFHHKKAAAVTSMRKANKQTELPIDLTKYQPNEAGMVPILEYHDLVNKGTAHGYQYPSAFFKRDIEWLYAHNYRPISLSDFVNGIIDCPAGTSPVVLTFDDALRGQFNYTPDGKIDPNCAVGILDAFHAQHPDWLLKGTFFVLTNGDPHLPPSFYQAKYAQAKLQYLVSEGFEIGNHTVHHRAGIRHWTDAQVQAEFASAVTNIHNLLPGYNVQTLALPYGVFPKNQKLVISGQSGGVSYHNICALLAGAAPAPSPMSKDFAPYRLPRIIPGTSQGERFALYFWLNELERDKSQKFVSDGDPKTYTVNVIAKGLLDLGRLKRDHFTLRAYNGTSLVASN